MAFRPDVDVKRCVGCGECIDVCPVNVYELQDGKSVSINEQECVGCDSCAEVCPEDAITVNES